MKRSEYEQRRRALEAQLAADIELVRAAHETRVRALESLWLASPEEEAASPAEGSVAAFEPPPDEEEAPETVPIGTQTGNGTRTGTQTPPKQAAPVRKGYGEVSDDLEAALTRMPEVFDKAALVRELGYEPARSTLYRALDGLQQKKKIVIDSYSGGRTRTTYRKVRNPGRREA
ncbi:MAG TPA: hypothetical protein VE685_04930 [Thermoanaerobaculia bacterium]|nr:hypothetical protein [Thermoanaerobaculia bacterium]